MDFKEALATSLNDGADMLWRAIEHTPEDKLDWKPAETSRTARELLEELVTTTDFSTGLVKTKKMEEPAEVELPKDVKELEKLHRAAIKNFVAAVKEYPEAELEDRIDLPWGNMSFFDVIGYPYWNMMYHYGQIAYIQTMYGDSDMY